MLSIGSTQRISTMTCAAKKFFQVRAVCTRGRHALFQSLYSTSCCRLQIFLPLNRQALLVVLTECVFEVSEYKVVRAVKSWTERSIWVQKAYNSAPMPRDQVHLIMQYTDPFCLTIEQFDELTFFNQPDRNIFSRYTVDLVWPLYASALLGSFCQPQSRLVLVF